MWTESKCYVGSFQSRFYFPAVNIIISRITNNKNRKTGCTVWTRAHHAGVAVTLSSFSGGSSHRLRLHTFCLVFPIHPCEYWERASAEAWLLSPEPFTAVYPSPIFLPSTQLSFCYRQRRKINQWIIASVTTIVNLWGMLIRVFWKCCPHSHKNTSAPVNEYEDPSFSRYHTRVFCHQYSRRIQRWQTRCSYSYLRVFEEDALFFLSEYHGITHERYQMSVTHGVAYGDV